MSTAAEIDAAVECFDVERLAILHSNSSYPAKPEELNLRCIQTLAAEYGCVVGYSGHEVGLSTSVGAVYLGASIVERHVTLDRASWGTDQAASLEAEGLRRLVRDIRTAEVAMGDGVKRVYESELPVKAKLRRVG